MTDWLTDAVRQRERLFVPSHDEVPKVPEPPFGTFGTSMEERLQRIRSRLKALAIDARADPAVVASLSASELLATDERCAIAESVHSGQGRLLAIAYLQCLADTAARKMGKVADGDTAGIICRRCGKVFVHPSVAAVLPVVGGWPRALGCPWCFVHLPKGVSLPRPTRPWAPTLGDS